MGHLRNLYLPQQAEWQTNVADIIADWPNLYRPRKESPYAATISWIRTKVSFAIRCYVYEGLEHREDANLQI